MQPQHPPPITRRQRLIENIGWTAFGLVLGAALAGAVAWMAAGTWIGAGFFAKQLCSGVFVSGRPAQNVVESDLRLYMPALVHRHMGWQVDSRRGEVRVQWLHGVERRARYKGNEQGCELVYDRDPQVVRDGEGSREPGRGEVPTSINPSAVSLAAVGREDGAYFRRVDEGSSSNRAVEHIVDKAFQHSASNGTRAVVVIHRGAVLVERYADGYDAQTRFPGWSLSKSVMNAMIGALVAQGRLRVDDPVPVRAWQAAGDPRSKVTYDQLLRMSSGLRFDENYDSPFSDVTRMLFGVADAGSYAESRPLAAKPGTRWSYSSGSTMVLAHALQQMAPSAAAYRDMPWKLLFDRIGMRSAVMETDAAGTFEATSSVYATALDWARFGWLYASDGVWDGESILPAGWVRYSASPSAADPEQRYGAHFWIYTEEDRARVRRTGAGRLPTGTFYSEGFGGQRITISPATQTVIVRLGASREDQRFDHALFAARILGALDTEVPRTRRAGVPDPARS